MNHNNQYDDAYKAGVVRWQQKQVKPKSGIFGERKTKARDRHFTETNIIQKIKSWFIKPTDTVEGVDDAWQQAQEQKAQPTKKKPKTIKVEVINIDMKFWWMVWFMVKWSFATIPALMIIITFCFVAFFYLNIFAGILAAFFGK